MSGVTSPDGHGAIEARLARVGVGTIVIQLERLGLRGCFMRGIAPVTPLRNFVGRARTLRCLPVRSDVVERQKRSGSPTPHRLAIDGVSPGEVLVIDARGRRDAAVMGDILAARVKAAGGVAAVTDGCIRDSPEVGQVGLPVYAAGVNSTTFSNQHVGIAVNDPIACGGVLVMPGDVLVGDGEGVVVIPADVADQVSTSALAQEELDAFVRDTVKHGVPLSRAYPPDEALLAEYERLKASGRAPS